MASEQKFVVVGAGPVGSLAALYAAQRGHQVEIYELRPGTSKVTYQITASLHMSRASNRGPWDGSGTGSRLSRALAAACRAMKSSPLRHEADFV